MYEQFSKHVYFRQIIHILHIIEKRETIDTRSVF